MISVETILQIGPVDFLLRLIGLAILSAICAGTAGFIYRSRIEVDLPETAGIIIGMGAVAVYLNTRLVFVQFVGEQATPLTIDVAISNLAIFAMAGIAAMAGQKGGQQLAQSDRILWMKRPPKFSPIVRATGRYITVKIPSEIQDIEGYDPVSDSSKEALQGRTFDFPRGMTVEDLERQLTILLSEKHDVGYVDVELTPDGAVEYLAVGQGPAGLGETLPPGMAAVAIRADPAFSASPGDSVEIWRGGEKPVSLGEAELRAVVGDVATLAGDQMIFDDIDPEITYRLMTHPGGINIEREFVALLRRSLETMGIIEIGQEAPLIGSSIGSVDANVLAIQRGDDIISLPDHAQIIHAGDRLFLLGRPDRLRKIEEVAGVSSVELDSSIIDPAQWATRSPHAATFGRGGQ